MCSHIRGNRTLMLMKRRPSPLAAAPTVAQYDALTDLRSAYGTRVCSLAPAPPPNGNRFLPAAPCCNNCASASAMRSPWCFSATTQLMLQQWARRCTHVGHVVQYPLHSLRHTAPAHHILIIHSYVLLLSVYTFDYASHSPDLRDAPEFPPLLALMVVVAVRKPVDASMYCTIFLPQNFFHRLRPSRPQTHSATASTLAVLHVYVFHSQP